MKKLMLVALALVGSTAAFAECGGVDCGPCPTPIQFSVFSPLELPWGERDVYGLRLDLPYGRSRTVYGVDLGVCGVTDFDFAGVALSGFNKVGLDAYGLMVGAFGSRIGRDFCGLELAGFCNWNLGTVDGVQLALVNYDNIFNGVALGLVNWSVADAVGLEIGFANVAKNDFAGIQLGFINHTVGVMDGAQIGVFNQVFLPGSGLQLGLVNAADQFSGVQIGALNLNTRAALTFMPIVNVNFR